MVSNTTQHPTPPPSETLPILYFDFDFGKGERWGRGTREKVRGALVHKAASKYQDDWLYLQSITVLNTSKDDF